MHLTVSAHADPANPGRLVVEQPQVRVLNPTGQMPNPLQQPQPQPQNRPVQPGQGPDVLGGARPQPGQAGQPGQGGQAGGLGGRTVVIIIFLCVKCE